MNNSHIAIPFSMLLNLASVSGAEEKKTLWGFIKRYQSEASPETHPDLDQAVGFAVAFYNDFVKPKKIYREANELEREAIIDLRNKLSDYKGDLMLSHSKVLYFRVVANVLIHSVNGFKHFTKYCWVHHKVLGLVDLLLCMG